jgi:hypothetical protein
MRNGALVEWMLTRFTDSSRAAAIVGDLEEAATKKGNVWFWRSAIGVVFSFAWRPLGGYLFAAFAGGLATSAIQSNLYASFEAHAPSTLQQSWTSSVGVVVGFLLIVACFSVIRFGVRDALTLSAASISLIGTASVCCWWQPMVPIVSAVATVLAFGIAMLSPGGRRGMAAVAMLSLMQVFVWWGGLTLFATFAKRFLFSESAIKISLGGSYLLAVWVVCFMCAWAHQLLLKRGDDRRPPSEFSDELLPGQPFVGSAQS